MDSIQHSNISYSGHGTPLVDKLNEIAAAVSQTKRKSSKKKTSKKKAAKKKATRKRVVQRSPVIREYLRRLTQDTQSLTMLGLGRSLTVDLPITEAYVPLRTMLARSSPKRRTGFAPGSSSTKNVTSRLPTSLRRLRILKSKASFY